MRRMWISFSACWLMLATVVGCGYAPSPGASDPNQAPPPATGTPALRLTVTRLSPTQVIVEEPVPSFSVIPTPSEPALQDLVTQARQDLARRLSIDAGEIGLLELKAVVWPDASLGCPQPGMAYIQVPQDGVLIRLGAGKRSYEYHGGSGTAPFLCEQSGPALQPLPAPQ